MAAAGLLLSTAFLFAQEPKESGQAKPGQAQETRAAEIERKRDNKAAHPKVEQRDKVENTLDYIEDHKILERLTTGYRGWNVRFGGLPQGSGFGLGPEYRLNSDIWQSNFLVGAQLSTKVYQKYYTGVTLPELAKDHISFAVLAVHRNYPQIDYFGPGPNSLKSNRTDYRLEDTSVDAALGLKPVRHLRFGGSAGYLWVNVGPGTSNSFPSTEQVFSPAVIPGIDRQTNFLRYGPYIQVDYLDKPAVPTGGGLYTFQYTWYRDQVLNLNSFRRLDAEIQQYFGFFNKTHVFAIRGKTTLTDADTGQVLPFYMQPVIGGSEDLRGFKPFRFYDNNSLVLNAEYRWHVINLFDMALFADGGKVFPRRGQLNFSHLQADGGIGFRFNINGRQFIRVDLAQSREGFQIWLKFNDVFVRRPVGTASAQPIY
jgi:Omp85 superfamily domain